MLRKLLIPACVALAVLILTGTALAEANEHAVADKREVTFYHPVLVGDVLLPAGDYQVRHTMQGDEHFMTFQQLFAKRPAGTRAKCKLVPVTKAIGKTQVGLAVNAAGEYVLHRLAFKGDRAEHWF